MVINSQQQKMPMDFGMHINKGDNYVVHKV